ncbi:MAG TPA: NUDIX domain-containing protein [Mycobacteriales bacterium]|jgi:8-oxo-dGTP pyrophosphatase MutT (NUDIX family)|nr:NUDIX domain-containing protein [Mycobacteriales bacterium]
MTAAGEHLARAAEVRRLHALLAATPRHPVHAPELQAAVRAFETPVRETVAALRRGDPGAVEEALAFLEADPRCFRSGYLKADVMHALAQRDLRDVRDRVRAVVAHRLRHREPRLLRHAARLAAAVWDEPLRRLVEEVRDTGDETQRAEAARLLDLVAVTAGAVPVVRPSARVLLLDDRDRLLLFRGVDPDRPGRRFWYPPGGGIEAGETAADAARREVLEETGLRDVVLGPHVWNRRHVAAFGGAVNDCRETWFLARVAAFDVDTSGFTELERRTITEHRWWTLAELAATTDRLTPRDLARLLAGLLRDGPPPSPVTVPV